MQTRSMSEAGDAFNKARSLFLKRLFLLVLLAMTFRTFQFFPGLGILQEVWFALCCVYFITIHVFVTAKRVWRVTEFEAYLLLMIASIPLLSGFSAWREFNQPMSYGLLSQRSSTLLVGVLIMMHGLRSKSFSIADVEKVLVCLAWALALLHLVMRTFLNPAEFASYGPGFVSGFGDNASFVLPVYFPVFGFFYYSFRGLKRRRPTDYLYASVFAFALLNTQGARALTLSLLATFLFYAYRWGGLARGTMLLSGLIVALAIVLGTFYLVKPDAVVGRTGKFADAFTVAFTGAKVDDVSANARMFEALLAITYLPQHPWVGNGNISNQWEGGNEGVLGQYFHPSDIGIIGVFYVYGVVGFSLFACQYIFARRGLTNSHASTNSLLRDASIGVLLFMALMSLTAGVFVFAFEVNCMFIALLRFTSVASQPECHNSLPGHFTLSRMY